MCERFFPWVVSHIPQNGVQSGAHLCYLWPIPAYSSCFIHTGVFLMLCVLCQNFSALLSPDTQLFGASLSKPWIHEGQEAVLYVCVYIYICVCGVIISVNKELNMKLRMRMHYAPLIQKRQTQQFCFSHTSKPKMSSSVKKSNTIIMWKQPGRTKKGEESSSQRSSKKVQAS